MKLYLEIKFFLKCSLDTGINIGNLNAKDMSVTKGDLKLDPSLYINMLF